ncbi:hypothetical protein [Cobetia sp. AM6]|uniref:hypothetical protein n=1 Tax=Cobetia sp. AM6 TaxID=2661553 RepID=UPI001299281C|nr:hypothetical protein [Cobetia sp. AM6]
MTFSSSVNNKREVNRFSQIVSFFIGFLFFSQLISRIQIDILNLPVFIYEPFFLIFATCAIFISNKKFHFQIGIKKLTCIVWICVFFITNILIGAYESSFIPLISSARPFFIIAFSAILWPYVKHINEKIIFSFLIGVLIGELIGIKVSEEVMKDWRGIAPVNVIALYLTVSLAICSQSWKRILLIAIIFMPLVFLSGFRLVIATGILSTIFSFIYLMIIKRKFKILINSLMIFITLLFTSTSLFLLFLWYGKSYFDIFAYYRVVNRVLPYFSGNLDKAQDTDRVDKMHYYLFEYSYDMLPSGFIMRARGLTGDFNDISLINLLITFGFVLGLFIILGLIAAGLKSLFRCLHSSNVSNIEIACLSFVPFFCFLLFVNGRYLYISYECVLFGIVIGQWLSSLNSSRITSRISA